jgi:alpha-beta hydrolase superfamily lysophospholipase
MNGAAYIFGLADRLFEVKSILGISLNKNGERKMDIIRSKKFIIEGIPAILWGEEADRVYIAVHGKMSRKEEAEGFAKKAAGKGYQVLSFDLPEHGDRKGESYPCNVRNGVHDLDIVGKYAEQHWKDISLFAVSLGAYFSLLAYRELPLGNCLFLSPILDMERLIQNMMGWFDVTEETLEEKEEIPTPMGETLSWDYYRYVKEHPVASWDKPTAILYGSRDNLTEREVVDRFTESFGCELTVLEGSEHYFHTKQQVDFLDRWLEEHI